MASSSTAITEQDVMGLGMSMPSETRAYLEKSLLPTLEKGIEELLRVAADINEGQVETTGHFNPINWLAQYLMRHNPNTMRRDEMQQEQADIDGKVQRLGISLMELLEAEDKSNTGLLDQRILRKLVKTAPLGLTPVELRNVLSEAEENPDAKIPYQDFVARAEEALKKYHTKMANLQSMDYLQELATQLSRHMLHGMPIAEFKHNLELSFQRADKGNRGRLSRSELLACLNSQHLGICQKEVNYLLSAVDADEFTFINYTDAVPTIMELLQEKQVDMIFDFGGRMAEISKHLLETFAGMDKDQMMKIHGSQACNIIRGMDLGLTHTQISLIVSLGDQDDKGRLHYRSFAPFTARMIVDMYSPDRLRERMLSYKEVDAGEPPRPAAVRSDTQEQFEERLQEAFMEVDVDSNGFLNREEFFNCLTKVNADMTSAEKNLLLFLADEDEDGHISYGEFVRNSYDVLVRLERERKVMEGMRAVHKAQQQLG